MPAATGFKHGVHDRERMENIGLSSLILLALVCSGSDL
jgi:hypothetical protein